MTALLFGASRISAIDVTELLGPNDGKRMLKTYNGKRYLSEGRNRAMNKEEGEVSREKQRWIIVKMNENEVSLRAECLIAVRLFSIPCVAFP